MEHCEYIFFAHEPIILLRMSGNNNKISLGSFSLSLTACLKGIQKRNTKELVAVEWYSFVLDFVLR